jgi:uncharacterized protein YggU (UPF0235/DUF167 family)
VTGDRTWLRYDAAARRLTVTLHVQPGARRSEMAGLHGNAALIKFLSEALEVPKSGILIRHGATGRRKVVDIAGGPELAAKAEKWR